MVYTTLIRTASEGGEDQSLFRGFMRTHKKDTDFNYVVYTVPYHLHTPNPIYMSEVGEK